MFYDILEGKNASLGYKNKKIQKSKNWDFLQSPWFMSKIGHFSIFLFLVIEAREMCFVIFWNEKTPF